MRAVVIYESQFGNTHLIADAIGAGLRSAYDVRVVPVAQADPGTVKEADFIVDVVRGLTDEGVALSEVALLYRSNAQSPR